jgi:hypothetical protein
LGKSPLKDRKEIKMSKKRACKRSRRLVEESPEAWAERMWNEVQQGLIEAGMPPLDPANGWISTLPQPVEKDAEEQETPDDLPSGQPPARISLRNLTIREGLRVLEQVLQESGFPVVPAGTIQREATKTLRVRLSFGRFRARQEKPDEQPDEQPEEKTEGRLYDDTYYQKNDEISMYVRAREDERYRNYREFELSQGRTPRPREQVIGAPGRVLTPVVDISKIGAKYVKYEDQFRPGAPNPSMSYFMLPVGMTTCQMRSMQVMGLTEQEYYVYEKKRWDDFLNKGTSATAQSKAKPKRRARRKRGIKYDHTK